MPNRDKKIKSKKNEEDKVPATQSVNLARVNEECGKCDVKFSPEDKTVQCSTCSTHYHQACQKVSDTMYDILSDKAESSGFSYIKALILTVLVFTKCIIIRYVLAIIIIMHFVNTSTVSIKAFM